MRKTIQSREDIQLLVDTFYKKVLADDLIGHFFTEVISINWDEHMPVMYRFWESVLLDNPVYKGNPISKHLALDDKSRIRPVHFTRWIELFHHTVDELFTGEKAELAKFRSDQIKNLMMYKVEKHREDRFIQ